MQHENQMNKIKLAEAQFDRMPITKSLKPIPYDILPFVNISMQPLLPESVETSLRFGQFGQFSQKRSNSM